MRANPVKCGSVGIMNEKRPSGSRKRVSLAPLSPEEAISAAFATGPLDEAAPSAKPPKKKARRKGRKTAKKRRPKK